MIVRADFNEILEGIKTLLQEYPLKRGEKLNEGNSIRLIATENYLYLTVMTDNELFDHMANSEVRELTLWEAYWYEDPINDWIDNGTHVLQEHLDSNLYSADCHMWSYCGERLSRYHFKDADPNMPDLYFCSKGCVEEYMGELTEKETQEFLHANLDNEDYWLIEKLA